MKCFIALCLLAVAVAEPEADPQVYVNPVYYAASPHHTAGFTKYSNGAITPTDTLSVQTAKAQHHTAKIHEYVKKAPIVASVPTYTYPQPAVTYTNPAAVTYTNQVVPTVAQATPVVSSYAHTPLTTAYTHQYHVLAKRDAESDAQLYTNLYTPYHYSPYYQYTPAVTTPYVYTPTVQSVYNSPSVYSSYYSPLTTTYRQFVKRDADADAEAQYYSSYLRPYNYYTPRYTSYSGVYNSYAPYNTFYNYATTPYAFY